MAPGDHRIAGGFGLLIPGLLRALGVPTGVILHNLADNADMQDAGFAETKEVSHQTSILGRIAYYSAVRADPVSSVNA